MFYISDLNIDDEVQRIPSKMTLQFAHQWSDIRPTAGPAQVLSD